MTGNGPFTLFWFRRDLRLEDNKGLAAALEEKAPVLPLFIFDPSILERLEEKADPRVQFIHEQIHALDGAFREKGSGLLVLHKTPDGAFEKLLQELTITSVHCNRDHEPYAIKRDERVKERLKEKGVRFHMHDDQNLFPPERVRKEDGSVYKVFTPYRKKAETLFDPEQDLGPAPSEPSPARLAPSPTRNIPSLETLGFVPSSIPVPPLDPEPAVLEHYELKRDYPSEKGTSQQGIHLRFGTMSIRSLARKAKEKSQTFLGELMWRDFFQTILREFPHVVDHAFKPEFDRIEWRRDPESFEAWCQGRTGYPLVDAGMRELKATGYMHNRCRMVTGSFLTKHLLLDWRLGEAWFARKLLDYELASNNGNWQWVAGCGCDAAPYFRIFNPDRQLERFDPERRYVQKWVPEYGTDAYPDPIVDHRKARERALSTFKAALE